MSPNLAVQKTGFQSKLATWLPHVELETDISRCDTVIQGKKRMNDPLKVSL